MRLSPEQIRIIREQAQELLGDSVAIWLFGSRTDDRASGGDIDLCLQTNQPVENRASVAARLAGRLQRALGDRKIDILLIDPHTRLQPIHEIARSKGISI